LIAGGGAAREIVVLRKNLKFVRFAENDQGRTMRLIKLFPTFLLATALAATFGCSRRDHAPDVSNDVRHALDQAGLNDVKVSDDRDKAVVTLSGDVSSDDDKARAESIARSVAGSQVVANEIGVRPNGDQGTTKKVDSDLDSGIDKNLDAMLVQHRLKKDVRYDVNNGVVTLKGDVTSQAQRSSVEKLATQVPNVKQVVNELEVKNQRATSTK
jgi:hyperosmotically inducible protein